jgi:hypothetical protein
MLRLLGPFLVAVAALMIASDRRLLRILGRAEAEDPRSAVPLNFRNPIVRWRLKRLVRGGAIGRAPGDRFYIDTEGLRLFRMSRRRRVVILMVMAVLLTAILAASGLIEVNGFRWTGGISFRDTGR